MRLIYKFYTRHTEQLDALFNVSNNLWNQALYIFRQRLDNDGTWLWYNDMDKIMKQTLNLNGECNYRLLKAQCSQQILRTLDKSIKAYCKSIKDWKFQSTHPRRVRLHIQQKAEYQCAKIIILRKTAKKIRIKYHKRYIICKSLIFRRCETIDYFAIL